MTRRKKGYVELGAPTPSPTPKAPPTPTAKAETVAGWQFVRASGEVALKGPYEVAHSFREGFANVCRKGEWGMIDREGRWVFGPRKETVWPCFQHRAGFKEGAKWGYFDPTIGEVAIAPRFDQITNFDVANVPLALFSVDGKWGVLRLDGSAIVTAEWDGIAIGNDGWIRVVRKNISGFVDPSGKQVIDVKFRCDNFSCGRALVNVDGKFGFIDHDGKMAIEPVYENGDAFSEGVAFVQKDGKYGLIDLDGAVVLPFEYEGSVRFGDGRAFVWLGGKVKCIDKTGRQISKMTFGDGNTFERGTAIVGKTDTGPYGLVDAECNIVLPMAYESIDALVGGHRKIAKKTKGDVLYGYVDERGTVVCEPTFSDAKPFPEDLAAIETSIELTESAPQVVAAHAPKEAKPATAMADPDDDVARVLLTPEQIAVHANLRTKPPLADEVIAVARDRAAIRKLLRSEDNYAQIGACPTFWLGALGVDAVTALEVALEVLRAHASKMPAWGLDAQTRNALTDCIAALDLVSSWESVCARARLFGFIPNPEKHLARSLRALAIVAAGTGAMRDEAARSFANIEAAHPGSVSRVLAAVPKEEASAFGEIANVLGIGLPEAQSGEIPIGEASGKKKLPDFWKPSTFARPLIAGRTKALPIVWVNEIAAHLEAGSLDHTALKRAFDARSLRDFAWSVFSAWLHASAPAKQKWALVMLGHFGDDDTVSKLAPMIAEWPGQSAHARAVLGLSVLGAIGSDAALRAIYRLSQRAKFGGLKGEAQSTIAHIAKQRGLTEEELADRLVPDFDLDDTGGATLDFGRRSFRVGFDESLRPFAIAQDGKRLDDLPKANQSDDATRAAEAHATWKSLKKEVRAIASLQIERLEKAMSAQRRWHADAFRMYFVEHPLLRHLSRRLVWGVHEKSSLSRTFRVAEDGSLADASDAAIEIPADALVSIVHPLELDAETLARWSRVMSDYEIVQPFLQLARDVYTITAEEKKSNTLTRFAKREVRGGAIMGLLSRGWSRGSVEDNGIVYDLHHALGEMRIEPGIYFGGDLETQTLGPISLRNDIDAVAFSEFVHTLTLL